jgi:hypothetical protein
MYIIHYNYTIYIIIIQYTFYLILHMTRISAIFKVNDSYRNLEISLMDL